MRTILFIIQKEFLQIFRNKQMLPIIFVMPIVQLFVLVHAANFEIRSIRLDVNDMDRSQASQLLQQKLVAGDLFRIVNTSATAAEGRRSLAEARADVALVIPHNFEQEMREGKIPVVQVSVDALNGFAAGVSQSYIAALVQDFNAEYLQALAAASVGDAQPAAIDISSSFWYNSTMEYDIFMAPGILVVLITMIGLFLAGMNIVKEKENGTIEQLNVTPINKVQFIAGKLLPFWLLALGELCFGMVFVKLVFDVPFLGSIALVFAAAAIYLVVILSLGLLISTVTETQQQAMFIAWFIMVIFILMSGMFTPIESMPDWAQSISRGNPVAYLIEIIRRVLLKGAAARDIAQQLWILTGMAGGVLLLAGLRQRKSTA